MNSPVASNFRLLVIFALGFALIVLGCIGARWTPGGVQMALLTVICTELAGTAVLLLAWVDLDKPKLYAFFATVGVAFTKELTHRHEPYTDALIQELLENPYALTAQRGEEFDKRMIARSQDSSSEFSDREREIAGLMPTLRRLSLSLQQNPKTSSL